MLPIPDECRIVDLCGESHDELAVDPIKHAAVPGDDCGEVFNLIGAFNPRCEESAKGGHQRGEEPKHDAMELHRKHADRALLAE